MAQVYTAYYSSACYSNPLPKSKHATTEASVCTRYDILSFLSLVNARNLDIFQTLSYDSSATLGDGGTAVVSQGVMAQGRGLAFKRLGSREDEIAMLDSDTSAESRVYKALMSEIFILTNAAIREHPNFIVVEAVCWEVNTSYAYPRILPVLIFQEAPHGDLTGYIRSQNQLDFETLLKLFCAIAKAVGYLHSLGGSPPDSTLSSRLGKTVLLTRTGLIHGDLKPGNILIFDDDHGQPLPKLADFGCSLQETDSVIKLPVSQGWNAPEADESYPDFTLEQAMKADIFSLGLILIWLLYKTSHVECVAEFVDFRETGSACSRINWRESARDIQKHGMGAGLVRSSLENLRKRTSEAVMRKIEGVLKLSVCVKPEHRAENCDQILYILESRS